MLSTQILSRDEKTTCNSYVRTDSRFDFGVYSRALEGGL